MIIIDRFEDGFAVCESEEEGSIKILKKLLPKGAKEGDVITISSGEYVVDLVATEKRKKEIQDKFFNLFE